MKFKIALTLYVVAVFSSFAIGVAFPVFSRRSDIGIIAFFSLIGLGLFAVLIVMIWNL